MTRLTYHPDQLKEKALHVEIGALFPVELSLYVFVKPLASSLNLKRKICRSPFLWFSQRNPTNWDRNIMTTLTSHCYVPRRNKSCRVTLYCWSSVSKNLAPSEHISYCTSSICPPASPNNTHTHKSLSCLSPFTFFSVFQNRFLSTVPVSAVYSSSCTLYIRWSCDNTNLTCSFFIPSWKIRFRT